MMDMIDGSSLMPVDLTLQQQFVYSRRGISNLVALSRQMIVDSNNEKDQYMFHQVPQHLLQHLGSLWLPPGM